MGEFSSGKSSFVNAFIGAEVAPTGITPTTATINVVRHGRERRGLLIYLDGRTEEVAWDDLFDRLRGLGELAREIARVEIMLPLDILERVNLVDTPGLNSILPEHEAVARGFIARADAVVWLFSAGQAGKASEREALESIRDQGVRVLAVLNKVDQLSDADAATVRQMLVDELGDYVETVVPVSARRALEDHPDSNWEELLATLESRFFDSANKIKDQIAARRIGELVDEIRSIGRSVSERITAITAELDAAGNATRSQLEGFADLVVSERREISLAVGELYRQASREVVELVLPRRLPFGSNKATRADRDYLISLLETGLEQALGHSRRRIGDSLGQALARCRAPVNAAGALLGGRPEAELSRAFSDAVALLDAQVYASALAYLRGYLRGGYVEQFFRGALPKLDIAVDAVFHALYRDAPDVDALIAGPLASCGERALDAVALRLAALSGALSVHELDFELGALAPAELIDGALERRTRYLAP
jgi:GTPase Era involved in 16S rRNA processing